MEEIIYYDSGKTSITGGVFYGPVSAENSPNLAKGSMTISGEPKFFNTVTSKSAGVLTISGGAFSKEVRCEDFSNLIIEGGAVSNR